MKTKSVASILAFVAGLALIVALFFVWKGDAANNIFYLNLAVSLIVYSLLFQDLIFPWISLRDKSGSRVGSLGSQWVLVSLYAVAAVGLMLLFALVLPVLFVTQLMVHLSLLFLLLVGFVVVSGIFHKVSSVHVEQTAVRQGVVNMKDAVEALKDRMLEFPDIPDSFTSRINDIEHALRFLAPSDNPKAAEYEDNFVRLTEDIADQLYLFSSDHKDMVDVNLRKLERELQKRKNLYSN